jgi:hypothetical protein
MLWRSLSSCQDLIRTFLSYQNQDLFYLTAFVCPRLLYAFITLAKLVALHSENGAGGPQSATSGFPGHSWSLLDFAREVNYQHLARQVFDKFTSVSAKFIGADGRQDSMANAASGMKMMIEGYERQMDKVQSPPRSMEMPATMGEISQQHLEANHTAYTRDQEVDDSSFDANFTWEAPENTFWDDILESFTIVPYL